MKMFVIVTYILCLQNYIRCNVNELADYVTTDIEVQPQFETIIFSDLVDVINEFNDNLKSGFDTNVSNDSEDKDSIDESILVSKYQPLLSRTQKQRKNFKDKGYDNIEPYYNNNSKDIKVFPRVYPFLSDTFYPYENKELKKSDRHPKKTLNTNHNCYCTDVYPCKCVASTNANLKSYNSKVNANTYEGYKHVLKNALTTDDLNIHINVDFKLPDFIEILTNIILKIFEGHENLSAKDKYLSNMYNSLSNFYSIEPFPDNKHVFRSKEKVSLHKKNNRHTNKAGRSQKNSRVATSTNVDNVIFETKLGDARRKSMNIKDKNNYTKNLTFKDFNSSLDVSQILKNNKSVVVHGNETTLNINKTETTGDVMFNFASEIVVGNNTEDFQKLENSIEKFEVAKIESTKLRNRREIQPSLNKFTEVTKDFFKNSTYYDDKLLLYWPPYNSISDSQKEANKISNQSVGVLPIQKEQIERNITNDKIINNLTDSPIEKILNETAANDVSAVARQFVYFSGKHLNGILTLCSESLCHSINCANKTCFERVCKPHEKFTRKGHCTAKHSADAAVAISTSVSSSKALKLIDHLKIKMAGKLFGKATLCESHKCVSFDATEKSFFKTNCTSKELTAKGHCPNVK